MNWIEKVLPLLGVMIGWLLSQYKSRFDSKKEERRKINKLLFNLIELRQMLYKESKVDQYIEQIKNVLKKKIPEEKLLEQVEKEFESLKPHVGGFLKQNILNIKQIKTIESNIDSLILEISEIYPRFAYELNGQHRISEKISEIERYFEFVENQANDPWATKEVELRIKPIIQDSFITELDRNILTIAKKAKEKTRKEIEEIIKKPFSISSEEIEEYFDKVLKIRNP
jgi:hypothetical protein